MSIRSAGQIERLLWAAAEARRLRAENEKAPARPSQVVVLVLPPEQFTTEWQTPYLGEPA